MNKNFFFLSFMKNTLKYLKINTIADNEKLKEETF